LAQGQFRGQAKTHYSELNHSVVRHVVFEVDGHMLSGCAVGGDRASYA